MQTGWPTILNLKDLFHISILGFIDCLGLLMQIGNPLLEERGPNDVTG